MTDKKNTEKPKRHPDRTCSSCKHFKGGTINGECTRHPPVGCKFPVVHVDLWCGEFSS